MPAALSTPSPRFPRESASGDGGGGGGHGHGLEVLPLTLCYEGPVGLDGAPRPRSSAAAAHDTMLGPRYSASGLTQHIRDVMAAAAALGDAPALPPREARLTAKRAAAAVALVALSLAGVMLLSPANVEAAVSALQDHPVIGLSLYGVVFAVGVVLMLPATVFTVAAGAAFGFWPGAFVSFVGNVAGMIAAFLLGRTLFYDTVTAALLRRVPNFEAVARGVEREGWRLVLLLRLSPLVPYNVLNFALGATNVRLASYALPSAAAAALYSVLLAYAGSAADDVLALLRGRGGLDWHGPWLYAAAALAVASGLGLAVVCRRMLRAPPGGAAAAAAGSGSGSVAAGMAAPSRKEYAPLSTDCDLDGAMGAGVFGGSLRPASALAGAAGGLPPLAAATRRTPGGGGWIEMEAVAGSPGGGGSGGGGGARPASAPPGAPRSVSFGLPGRAVAVVVGVSAAAAAVTPPHRRVSAASPSSAA